MKPAKIPITKLIRTDKIRTLRGTIVVKEIKFNREKKSDLRELEFSKQGKELGVLLYTKKTPEVCLIETFDPFENQTKGLGKKLLKYAEKHQLKDCKTIETETIEDTRKFWKKQGFKTIIPEGKVTIDGKTMVQMEIMAKKHK